MTANLSSEGFLELCSHECRLSFMQDWIQLHLQEAARLGEARVFCQHLVFLWCFVPHCPG